MKNTLILPLIIAALLIIPLASADYYDDFTTDTSASYTVGQGVSGWGTGAVTLTDQNYPDSFILRDNQEYILGENVTALITIPSTYQGTFEGLFIIADNGSSMGDGVDGYGCVRRSEQSISEIEGQESDSSPLAFLNAAVSWVTTTTTVIYDDTPYWYKMNYDGSTLRCKAWENGTGEPGTWDIEAAYTAPPNTIGRNLTGVVVEHAGTSNAIVYSLRMGDTAPIVFRNLEIRLNNTANNSFVSSFTTVIDMNSQGTTNGSTYYSLLDGNYTVYVTAAGYTGTNVPLELTADTTLIIPVTPTATPPVITTNNDRAFGIVGYLFVIAMLIIMFGTAAINFGKNDLARKIFYGLIAIVAFGIVIVILSLL